MTVPRLVLNVLIFLTPFRVNGNLFQACAATEKKVLARCLSLIAGNSYSSPLLLVCGLISYPWHAFPYETSGIFAMYFVKMAHTQEFNPLADSFPSKFII